MHSTHWISDFRPCIMPCSDSDIWAHCSTPEGIPEDQPLSAGVVCITLTQQNWQLGWSWKAEPWPNFRPVWFEVVVGWYKVTFRMTVILFLRPVTKLRKSLCPRMASLVLCNCFKIKSTWKKKGIISYEGVKKIHVWWIDTAEDDSDLGFIFK